MNWLYLVIFSNFLFAIVFALDKVLVKKIVSPLKYALIIGAFEGLAVILIPFVDFVLPQSSIIFLAFLSAFCLGAGLYFYFKAFAFILLLAGGFVISFSRQHKTSSIFYLIVSAIFISLGYVFLKIVFNNANFISGYILTRLGGFLTAIIVYFIVY